LREEELWEEKLRQEELETRGVGDKRPSTRARWVSGVHEAKEGP